MSAVWTYLTLITNISLSQYETSFVFNYLVDYSVPQNTNIYFSTRINEAKNFSSITTGVAKDFFMKSSFTSKDDTPLSIVHMNPEMSSPSKDSFITYQRDFFDSQLSKNNSRYKSCPDYFSDCEGMALKEYSSTMKQMDSEREDFFLINKNLQPNKKDPHIDSTLHLKYSTEASVTLLHFKISNSLYYLILAGIVLHSVVLLFNVIILIRKRKALQVVITKVKTQ